jgi:hypothetical protein
MRAAWGRRGGLTDPAGIKSRRRALRFSQSGTLFDSASSPPPRLLDSQRRDVRPGHGPGQQPRRDVQLSQEIAVTGRLSGDALGTLQPPTLAQSSTFTYNPASESPALGLLRKSWWTPSTTDSGLSRDTAAPRTSGPFASFNFWRLLPRLPPARVAVEHGSGRDRDRDA